MFGPKQQAVNAFVEGMSLLYKACLLSKKDIFINISNGEVTLYDKNKNKKVVFLIHTKDDSLENNFSYTKIAREIFGYDDDF